MGESWRLFIAVELPADLLKSIEQLQNGLKNAIGSRAARWVRPEGIHLTLKFLGDTAPDKVEAITAGMTEAGAASQPFELKAQGLGCFPNLERPRVLWLGLTGNIATLRSLQARIEDKIAPLGFPTETRAFNPHLTLARTAQTASRGEAAAIGAAAMRHDPGEMAAWRVTSISLMRSQLKPDGAVYSRVAEAGLGQTAG